MSDDTIPLLLNEEKDLTTEQECPQPEQQPKQEPGQPQVPTEQELRKINYNFWMLGNIFLFVVNMVWAIAYIIVFAITDPVTCTGGLYTFGSAARWVLFAFGIWDGICSLIMKWYRDQSDQAQDKPPAWYRFSNIIYYAGFLGFWGYSIFAIFFKREGCDGEMLTRLLWDWVYIYAIYPLLLIGAACCFGCSLILKSY